MTDSTTQDLRLIEHGFPCHQVGAETRRERDTGQAPPTHRLHVWWARRPLTPSRAAILASLLPDTTDTEQFVRSLGIESVVVCINGQEWVLPEEFHSRIRARGCDSVIEVTRPIRTALQKEQRQRALNQEIIRYLIERDPSLSSHPAIRKFISVSEPILEPYPEIGSFLLINRVMADPAWFNELMQIAQAHKRSVPNLYGYSRGYYKNPPLANEPRVVLDPTSGGGSIPFEALRLGHRVVANELNPVASVILHATLVYPARFGSELLTPIRNYGERLLRALDERLDDVFARTGVLPEEELSRVPASLRGIEQFATEHVTSFLFTRTVACPHCGGEAPLLNTCWLSKELGDQWGVRVEPQPDGSVRFQTYRAENGRGPNGEDPETGTVTRGTGFCLHCKQAIEGSEVKAQARGESERGKWRDVLYSVVAIRYEPVLDVNGNPARYASGDRKGEIKTRKARFFRPPNERDLAALAKAERRLKDQWDTWDNAGILPTEKMPDGYRRTQRDCIDRYGIDRWLDMFMPRQILGHVTLIEELNKLKPVILGELGPEKGRAVVTYLQFAIDKGIDYNSKQTRWIAQRGQVSGTFGRHDFSLKWTFGEMIFSGPNSGAVWGLSQVLDAYEGISELVEPLHQCVANGEQLPLRFINGTATHMEAVPEDTVDVICMDPPYYNNVQYAELSDYFYVWQKRTLSDLYPDLFTRRLTNKDDEAVANPTRDGGEEAAQSTYERMMREIFSECRRVLKDNGIMTMMFTHKTQEAWEALTRALIESGWTITSSFPVDSEFANSQHQMNVAAAASSIFIACRKRSTEGSEPAVWSGFGGSGVQQRIRSAVKEGLKDFAALRLNPVDEMVASYGRALRVLSENWPVLDGDEPVSPVRAMNEASSVVAQNQVSRITQGQLSVDDLQSEAAMALTLFGVFGTASFAYDEALNLSKSLNIRLESKSGGYEAADAMIGINTEERANARSGDKGYFAPLVRNGSKLRLALPEERNPKRLEKPQTDWDLLHGLIVAYRKGDVPVARAYLAEHAPSREQRVLNLLAVWEAEIGDPKLAKEAAAIRFGLRNV